MANHIIDLFLAEELDEIHVIYTKMQNAMLTTTEMIQLLPLHGDLFPSNKVVETDVYIEDFDPLLLPCCGRLSPNYVKGILYGAMVESYAAEQNARMAAMDSATENAKEIISNLSLEYNRIRQAAITTERSPRWSPALLHKSNRRYHETRKKIAQVIGPVVDVAFDGDYLPRIKEAPDR